MGDRSGIEWTDATWNPIHGCSKVSAGCTYCYAERLSHRFGWTDKPWNEAFAGENVQFHPERLEQPLRWRKPRNIFVNSMSDLFHEQVPFEYIDEVFAVMLACETLENLNHTFQVLTKRPKRMVEYLTHRSPNEMIRAWAKAGDGIVHLKDGDVCFSEYIEGLTCHDWDSRGLNSSGSEYKPWGYVSKLWPLPNLWIGVSVEDQKAANERIPLLFETPASVRFLSMEPLLGAVDLFDFTCETLPVTDDHLDAPDGASVFGMTRHLDTWEREVRLDWVIVGGESGSEARPMNPVWVRSLRDQCVKEGIPFFFKQWGEWMDFNEATNITNLDMDEVPPSTMRGAAIHTFLDETKMFRIGKKYTGRKLDGRTWDELPHSKSVPARSAVGLSILPNPM